MPKAYDFVSRRGDYGPDGLLEMKYDGYRLRVERNGNRVRPITRNGYDWTRRYPWIVESALTSCSPFSREKGGYKPSTRQADC